MKEINNGAFEISDEDVAKVVGGGGEQTSLYGYSTSDHYCSGLSPTQAARAAYVKYCCGICTHYESSSNICDAGRYPDIKS